MPHSHHRSASYLTRLSARMRQDHSIWSRRWHASRERGASVTLLATILVPALLMCVGLIVDGGGKINAARTAQTVASEAARAAQNAAASGQLHGKPPGPAAYQAAQSYLTATGITGTVTLSGRRVTVRTTATHHPVFLSMIGIDTMTADGQSTAILAVVGP